MLDKGTRVLIHASVFTKNRASCQRWQGSENLTNHKAGPGASARDLRRCKHDPPIEGIVIGTSFRISGAHYWAKNGDDVGYIKGETRHHVILVERTDTSRFTQPVPCLEEDLEVVDETGSD